MVLGFPVIYKISVSTLATKKTKLCACFLLSFFFVEDTNECLLNNAGEGSTWNLYLYYQISRHSSAGAYISLNTDLFIQHL